jgi:hypothetical protein
MTAQIEHVLEYPVREDETPRCAEDCPACTSYDVPDDRSEACGESGCLCYGTGEDHADCACGCDCPRYTNDIGEYVIAGNG